MNRSRARTKSPCTHTGRNVMSSNVKTLPAAANRLQMAAAGMRYVVQLTEFWDLSETQTLALLGHVNKNNYKEWRRAALNREPITVPDDVFLRLAKILAISHALRVRYKADADMCRRWINTVHPAPVFCGKTPLSLMTHKSTDKLELVRKYIKSNHLPEVIKEEVKKTPKRGRPRKHDKM